MKVKKKFLYNGIELRIIERDEPYMNAHEPMRMTRVMAPNGGTIPINISRKDTLNIIIKNTISTLDGFKSRGADVINELTKKITE